MKPLTRYWPIVAAALILTVAACSQEADSGAAEGDGAGDMAQGGEEAAAEGEGGQGLEGRAVIVSCARVRVGEDCPERPYPTTLFIRDAASGEVITRAECDDEGYFHVELEPGRYIVESAPSQALTTPQAAAQEVVVEAGAYTEVVMRYDSGVR